MASKHAMALGIGIVLLLSGAAQADAIDGRWCNQDGRRLAIRGPEITTPGGNRISGDYSRHNFSYVVPASEPSAGQTVYMRLLGEYLMHSRLGAPAGEGAAGGLESLFAGYQWCSVGSTVRIGLRAD